MEVEVAVVYLLPAHIFNVHRTGACTRLWFVTRGQTQGSLQTNHTQPVELISMHTLLNYMHTLD
jgi:uncharacterized protein HemY